MMEDRTKNFSIGLIKVLKSVSNNMETLIIKRQLIRSGTSIGANYREANHSRSKADFANKIRICEGECNESIYWLEILYELESSAKGKLSYLVKELKELLGIFSSISKSLKSHH